MPHHRQKKIEGAICEVKGCEKEAERSMPKDKVQEIMTQGLKDDVGRRAHLCKDHYREYRKKTKTDRLTDRLAWDH